jgi:hypothetical protein
MAGMLVNLLVVMSLDMELIDKTLGENQGA